MINQRTELKMQNNYKIILEIYKSWLFEGTNTYINLWED